MATQKEAAIVMKRVYVLGKAVRESRKMIVEKDREAQSLSEEVTRLEGLRKEDCEVLERYAKDKLNLAAKITELEAKLAVEAERCESIRQQMREESERRVSLRIVYDRQNKALWEIVATHAETATEKAVQKLAVDATKWDERDGERV